jgi:hypothetical protein
MTLGGLPAYGIPRGELTRFHTPMLVKKHVRLRCAPVSRK